jgi:hypothetical protein
MSVGKKLEFFVDEGFDDEGSLSMQVSRTHDEHADEYPVKFEIFDSESHASLTLSIEEIEALIEYLEEV